MFLLHMLISPAGRKGAVSMVHWCNLNLVENPVISECGVPVHMAGLVEK